MTSNYHIGNDVSSRCPGQHQHMLSPGGGRTRRSETDFGKPCRTMRMGRVRQMMQDDHEACSHHPGE
eukprot:1960229-Pyramimonas_sp.AAC.1